MSRILVLFFILYVLNQFSFLFYNYSWFSLLCSTYVIDFYTFFYFLLVNLTFLLCVSDISIFFVLSEFTVMVLDRWFEAFLYFNVRDILLEFVFFNFIMYLHDIDNIYCLYFDTKVIGNTNIYFYILQNKLFLLPGETTLSFFRIYNENSFPVSGITIYSITPFELQSFINKIQCFCFEEIIVNGFETIELPVLFYLDTNVVYLNSIQLKEFCIEYVLLCSKVA